MKTYRTAAQWLELLQRRSNFKGTNIEFCQHHNVAITTYYKQRALLAEYQPNSTLTVQKTNPISSRFIPVNQTPLKSARKLIKMWCSLISAQAS